MQVDRIHEQQGYNLRSQHRLTARDGGPLASWLGSSHPVFAAFLRLMRRRITTRKEFYETLFALERLAPELGQTRTLVDVGAGHSMFGIFAALLHPQLERVIAVDTRFPPCRTTILERLALDHPWLKVKLRFVERPICAVRPPANALVVGVHCCGSLTDELAATARRAAATFAVVPCCEERRSLPPAMRDSVPGAALPQAVNAERASRWRGWGYSIEERSLPYEVTRRTRLFVAAPRH